MPCPELVTVAALTKTLPIRPEEALLSTRMPAWFSDPASPVLVTMPVAVTETSDKLVFSASIPDFAPVTVAASTTTPRVRLLPFDLALIPDSVLPVTVPVTAMATASVPEASIPNSCPMIAPPVADCVSVTVPRRDSRLNAVPDPSAAVVGMTVVTASVTVTDMSRFGADAPLALKFCCVLSGPPSQVKTPVEVSVQAPTGTRSRYSFLSAAEKVIV